MGEYILDFLVTGLILGVVFYLSYIENSKTVRLALSLLLIVSLLFPVVSSLAQITDADIDSFFDSENEKLDTDTHSEVAKGAFEEGIKKALVNEFSLSNGDLTVRAYGFDFKTMRAENITVSLYGKNIAADTFGIRQYIESTFLCRAEVKLALAG